MTESGLDAGPIESVDIVDNVLKAPLEPIQLALISAVFEPIHNFEDFETEAAWPTWDFVSRRVYADYPDTDAVEVLRSLPQVATGNKRRPTYGLVWWGAYDVGKPPELNVSVGLTIAGLHSLGDHMSGLATADELAEVIQKIASADARIKPKPREVVGGLHRLSDYTVPLRRPYMGKPYAFSDDLTRSVLRQEYAPIESEPDGVTVRSGAWLRPYLHATNSSEYLDIVNSKSLMMEEPEYLSSPLTLVQTMDYLTYVLRTHPKWPNNIRLVNAPDIESACMLGLPARNRYDYDARLTALFTVIDRFNVPREEGLEEGLNGKTPAALNLLETWFISHLEEPERSEAVGALRVLRAARALRNERQHSSMDTRKKAIAARRSFGLPDVTSDWGRAWDEVSARVATALDDIRKAAQSG